MFPCGWKKARLGYRPFCIFDTESALKTHQEQTRETVRAVGDREVQFQRRLVDMIGIAENSFRARGYCLQILRNCLRQRCLLYDALGKEDGGSTGFHPRAESLKSFLQQLRLDVRDEQCLVRYKADNATLVTGHTFKQGRRGLNILMRRLRSLALRNPKQCE